MSSGNFASLTAGLLVRKPSSIMVSETPPFARRSAFAPVDAPIPPGPTPRRQQRELPAPSKAADLPAKSIRMFVQLSAAEHKALGLMAVRKDTSPQRLLRTALREFLVEFVAQRDGPSLAPGPFAISPGRVRAREQTVPYPSGRPCS